MNQRCSQGWTALHEAACRNSVDICRILLQAGAKVGATNTYGVTPLFLAAQGGRLEALEFLIHNGEFQQLPILQGSILVIFYDFKLGVVETIFEILNVRN